MKTLIAGCCLIASSTCSSANLTVQLTDVKGGPGKLMVAVYNATDFMRRPLATASTFSKDTTCSVVIEGLAAGEYAVAVYNDVNLNGALDRNLVGIPIEDYAFSNNATGRMGPPNFSQARLTWSLRKLWHEEESAEHVACV